MKLRPAHRLGKWYPCGCWAPGQGVSPWQCSGPSGGWEGTMEAGRNPIICISLPSLLLQSCLWWVYDMCDVSSYNLPSAGRVPLALDTLASAGSFWLARSAVPAQNMDSCCFLESELWPSRFLPWIHPSLHHDLQGSFSWFWILLQGFEAVVSDDPESKLLLCHFPVKDM